MSRIVIGRGVFFLGMIFSIALFGFAFAAHAQEQEGGDETPPATGGGSTGGTLSGGTPIGWKPDPELLRILAAAPSGSPAVPETVICESPLTSYLRRGYDNDVTQVKILQSFLNDNLGTSLKVDGIFGEQTELAVKQFQAKYANDTLTPWGGDTTPTGIVYITTLHKINELRCPGGSQPEIPETLIPFSQNPETSLTSQKTTT